MENNNLPYLGPYSAEFYDAKYGANTIFTPADQTTENTPGAAAVIAPRTAWILAIIIFIICAFLFIKFKK